jgi:hypothetical protein
LTVSLAFYEKQPLDDEMKLRYFNKPHNIGVKVLNIAFTIADSKDYIKDNLKVTSQEKNKIFNDHYYWMEAALSRNRISYPYQQCKFERNRIFLSKHFNLAFQGGGAKGLAYVGAYRAIREEKCKNLYAENKEIPTAIPIKSIMGSSAGGIIALAISTEIPEYELQKICYKMKDIPIIDRF